MEESQKSNLLITKTIDLQVDPNDLERVIKNTKCLDEDEKMKLIEPFLKFSDIFAQTYLDMLDIDPMIITHNIALEPNAKPIKKMISKMNPSINLFIKA